MRNSKETKRINVLCVLFVLSTGLVRLFRHHLIPFSSNIVTGALLITALFLWYTQMRRRLLHPDERKYLTWMSLLIAFLLILRTIKFVFLPNDHITNRYAWYLYYFPQTFTVLLMFFTVLHIGRPHNRPISTKWKLLYLPAALLSLGILTNDLHQLAFRFPDGVANYDRNYIHGPLYYLSLFWVVGLFLVILVIALTRCAISANKKNVWMPLVPLGFGLLYCILFLLNPDNLIQQLFKSAEMICFVFPAFMEGLILARLLPSNDSYAALWYACNLSCGLMDHNGVLHYVPEQQPQLSPAEIRAAAEQPILLNNGTLRLRSHPVSGGFGYWLKDISEINHINAQLAELGDVLEAENTMLEGENRLAEQRSRIHQQSALYDSIAQDVRPQLDQLNILLNTSPQTDSDLEQVIKHAAILIAYIKRRSNLLLLSHERGVIYSSELRLALAESLEYTQLYGAKVHGEYIGEALLPAPVVLLIYLLFEAVLEAALPDLDALLIRLEVSDAVTLRMELSGSFQPFDAASCSQRLAPLHGTLTVEQDAETEFITLIVPKGGA